MRITRTEEQIAKDIVNNSKVCSICITRKCFKDYYNLSASKDGKNSRCKTCDDKIRKKFREDNPLEDWIASRNRNLKHFYGMDLDRYNQMLEEQNGGCKLCGLPEKLNKVAGKFNSLSVDHCHDSGKVRGLLCNPCNRALGFFKHKPEVLNAAADYLRQIH